MIITNNITNVTFTQPMPRCRNSCSRLLQLKPAHTTQAAQVMQQKNKQTKTIIDERAHPEQLN